MKKRLCLLLCLGFFVTACDAATLNEVIDILDEELNEAPTESATLTDSENEEPLENEATMPTSTPSTAGPILNIQPPASVSRTTSAPANASNLNSEIQNNMRTVQAMFETYGVDWGGVYPASISDLYQEAALGPNPYFKSVNNPVSNKSWDQNNPLGLGVIENDPPTCSEGLMYVSVNAEQSHYWIGGCDASGSPMELTLSNS